MRYVRMATGLAAALAIVACESSIEFPEIPQIPFKGLELDTMGVAAWNTTWSGYEPAGTGHGLTLPSCATGPVEAYYYLASRDGGVYQIDPGSRGGIRGLTGMTGFEGFASALEATNGFAIDSLTMIWGLQSLGSDVEDKDWWLDGSVETRFYSGGEFTIKLGGEDLVGGPMPRTILFLDYNDFADCSDDQIYGLTDPVAPRDRSGNSQQDVKTAAAAFLNDLGDQGIRFIFDSYEPAVQQPEFVGNGRTGAFFDLQTGRIETAGLSVPVAWGANSNGQLGVGTNSLKSSPVPVEPLSDFAAVAGGGMSSLALKNDHTVWWWGDNAFGTGTSSPVQVNGLPDVVAIAAGWWHRLALDANGTVWAWGGNSAGQLGDGCAISIPVVDCKDNMTPAQVSNLSDVVAIAAGAYHSLALKKDSTVWAWGLNAGGQLGDLTTISRSTPVPVQTLPAGLPLRRVVEIAVGGGGWFEPHSLALRKDSTVWAWGANGSGQLGNGSNTPSLSPVQVVDPSDASGYLTGVIGIAAGGEDLGSTGSSAHSLALKRDATVWAWGANGFGQLGDGTRTDSSFPVQVSGLPGGVAALAAGARHSLALRPDGTVWVWGGNHHGELGDDANTADFSSTPVRVSGLTGVVAIAAGFRHNLAITVPPWR